jgi:hypothetical protein
MRITRKKLFDEVDRKLHEGGEGLEDVVWLIGAVVLLREVTKEDEPVIAHYHVLREGKVPK